LKKRIVSYCKLFVVKIDCKGSISKSRTHYYWSRH
jgi:hypothetical protein